MTRPRPRSSSRLEGVRAVLFDLEGVLDDHLSRQHATAEMALREAGVKLHYKVSEAYRLRTNPFMHEKVPFLRALLLFDRIGIRKVLGMKPDALEKALDIRSKDLTDAELERISKAAEGYSRIRREPEKLRKFIKPIAGSKTLLSELKRAGLRVGVVTNANPAMARYLLENHGLDKHVDALITGEDVTREKPDPQGIRLLLKRLRIKPTETILIEDSLAGIRAGKEAKLKATIGVLTGLTGKKEFENAGGNNRPDIVLNRAYEILSHLR